MSATSIHPTAIVHPGAVLGQGVAVGPYCVVGAGVEIGDRCVLEHHVCLDGPSRIGAENRFHAFTCIGQQTQDLKYQGEPTHLEMGARNTFREFSTVHRGTAPGSATRIGDDGNFLAYSHIAHDCVVGDRVIFSNNGTIAGHVEVGDGAVIGGLSAVHQFCRIGKHAITGGCSKIVQDVPPYMIADGNPAEIRGFNRVGLERAGFPENAIRGIKCAYRILFRSGLNLQQAIEELRTECPESAEAGELIAFVTASARGIVR